MSMLKRTARKKYRLVCLLCAAGTSLSAQGWDSTYRPDIYQARVSLFSTMPATKKDMVFIGDSITFWGDWGELLGNKKIKNRGIPGDTSFGLLERLASTIAGKPSGILIMIGINDLARGIPADVLLTNYKRILDTIRLHSPRTKIYFQSILPINDAIGKLHNHYKHAGELPAINTRIRDFARVEAVGYVDLFNVLADGEGKLKRNCTWDGVHLTAEGYYTWLAVLQSKKILK